MKNRTCPITNTDKFEEYYSSHNGKIMTSDQRTISGELNKIFIHFYTIQIQIVDFGLKKSM